MRRFGVAIAGCTAAAVVTLTALGGTSDRLLPLRSPPLATPHLTAIVTGRHGSRLVRLDASSFAVERSSSPVGWFRGWVRSAVGHRVAVATCPHRCTGTLLRFANPATLRWEPRGVLLDGQFYAAAWPRPRTLLALVGGETALTLVKVDPFAMRIVASTPVTGPIFQTAHSTHGLVLLAGQEDEVAPARLVVVAPDGRVHSVQLGRIRAGTRYDRQSRYLLGTTNMPGLAVDPRVGVAYVVDGSGLVAAVRLGDLSVSYHRLGSGSLLTRLADWLTPPAQAKDANGPTISAQWLGSGLLAVAGSDETATAHAGSQRPTGLRIVDTRNWSVRMLDPNANTGWVGDGVLLATGTSGSYTRNSSHVHREGLVAYGPDGHLRWRLTGVVPFVLGMHGSRAVLAGPDGFPLVDLASGHVIRKLPRGPVWDGLLHGAGSP